MLVSWILRLNLDVYNFSNRITQKDLIKVYILTHTSKAKCFSRIHLIHKRDLAEIIVPFRGYGRHSPNQVMIKSEWFTDKVLLSFSQINVLIFDKIALQWIK